MSTPAMTNMKHTVTLEEEAMMVTTSNDIKLQQYHHQQQEDDDQQEHTTCSFPFCYKLKFWRRRGHHHPGAAVQTTREDDGVDSVPTTSRPLSRAEAAEEA